MILLDTHALVWWVSSPEKLSKRARRTVEEALAQGGLLVSSIAAWEIAVLVKKGRLRLDRPVEAWLGRVEAIPEVEFVPVDNAIALRSVAIEGLHDDPADRMIVATAMVRGLVLVTKDKRLCEYGLVETVW